MTTADLDATHDPHLQSWVPSANAPDTDFPPQNLPFGRLRPAADAPWRIGVAIGDQVLDLALAAPALAGVRDAPAGLADDLAPLAAGDLNAFMARGPRARRAVRAALSAALRADSPLAGALAGALHAQSAVEMALPCHVGDYTDFYTGIHHATAVGRLFRPDNPLLPNYKWVPIGYHGRGSSLVVSGHPVRRPRGQTAPPAGGDGTPGFGPSRRVDCELELGFLIGAGNALGEPIPIGQAAGHLFGVTLLNDWSARDIQPWEYQPLGPFLAKNFATTLSPWVVTAEALAPFRVPFTRPAGDPAPLPYLDDPADRASGLFDIRLEVRLQTAAMRAAGQAPVTLSRSRMPDAAYWTPAQLIAHHTVNGCNLQPGDLLGSGTLSGPGAGESGSLLELTHGGREPIHLPGGERRTFLEDDDLLALAGWCEAPGVRRIGFGPCEARVLPAA